MDNWLQNLIVFLGLVTTIIAIVKPIINLSHNVVRLTTVIEQLLDSDKLQDARINDHEEKLNKHENELGRLDLEVKYIKDRV